MAIPIVTHPVTKIPWQPSKRQVIAAAMAIRRLDPDGWNRLQQSERDDLMIDGHAAIIAAYRQSPQDAFADHSGQGDAGDVICMTREHADAYAELFAATEAADIAPLISARTAAERVRRAAERLRALASPESA
ncbi:MAG TPA: hypothetical protein VHX44_09495 [Planctomycetota bacterium]|jgi:hypothetical protein|nr:hypothetical protein [Planctomycetota bacterium]